jgi:transposase
VFFPPKYSSDLNPIEGISPAQALVAQGRRALGRNHLRHIGEILRAFTPTECANYFRNSGYAQS